MSYSLFVSRKATHQMMIQVLIALLPGLFVMAWINHLWLIPPITCTLSALFTEALLLKLRSKNPLFFIQDGSAAVAGLLLGICLPPESPLWLAIVGGFTAIALGKQVYGGLGANPFNPAMVGYVVLLLGFPSAMTQWQGITTTGATLLDQNHELHWSLWLNDPLYWHTTILAFAFTSGGLWLLYRNIISWHIPVGVLTGFFLTQLSFSYTTDTAIPMTLTHLGGVTLGGLLYGAFFIATDPVTTSGCKKTQFIVACIIGFLTALIRQTNHYPEGFAFAIILSNLISPSLQKLVQRHA